MPCARMNIAMMSSWVYFGAVFGGFDNSVEPLFVASFVKPTAE